MKMYKQVCKLSNIKRFAALKLAREYSGADHSYRVAMLSMFIVDEYNSLNPKTPINMEEVLRKALIHDLEESITGDIPTPVKSYPGFREMLRDASMKIMEEQVVDQELPARNLYIKLWKEDKDGATGEVIIMADRLEALLSAAYELKIGNKDLQKAFNNIRDWFHTPEAMAMVEKFPIVADMLTTADEMPISIEASKLVG